MSSYSVAVVGATGLVGETMIKVLEERDFPVSRALSAGEQPLARQDACSSRAASYPVLRPRRRSISARRDIGLFSAGGSSLARVRAEGRGGRLHRHRQHQRVPLRRRHPAGGAGGESARHRAVQEARHHRQSQLLDHPDAGGAEAHPRCGRHRAHQRGDLSVRVRRGPRSGGGAGHADRGAAAGPGPGRGRASSRSRSPSTSCRRSTSSRTTATPRKR